MKKRNILLLFFLSLFTVIALNSKVTYASGHNLNFPESVSTQDSDGNKNGWETITQWINQAKASSQTGASIVAPYSEKITEKQKETKRAAFINSIIDFEDVIKIMTNFMFGFAILTSVLCLIIIILRLAGSGINPSERKSAVVDLGLSLICVAMLGSVKVISLMIIQIALKS